MADILLAFGTHGSGRDRPDGRFFRNAVMPFIERAVSNGRRVAVIHEFSVYGGVRADEGERSMLAHCGTLEGAAGHLRDFLSDMQERANMGLRCTLDVGLHGEPIDDWGYNDRIRSINARRPGSILNIVEPQSLESLVAYWKISEFGKGIGPEGVGTMMGFIRTMAEDCIRRDRGVLGMVERTAALDPDAAIVVPRGSGHRGMVALLGGSSHQVHVAERLDCEDFMDRAVRASYGRTLGDDELRAYAVLELELMKFVHARMESFACRAAGMVGAARWLRGRLVREGMARLDADIAGA